MIVDDALERLDTRLDAAFLAGLPFVRVIHGKGTGRLREAIRQAMKGNPYAASFEPGKPGEGGDGVTVIHLANK
jgi:DNA mismatch repair protein MutS2